jgi:hypothetical protein
VLVDEANLAAPEPRVPKYIVVVEIVNESDCATVPVIDTVSFVMILAVIVPLSTPAVTVRIEDVADDGLVIVVVPFTVAFDPRRT